MILAHALPPPEILAPVLAWVAAGAGLRLRVRLPFEIETEEAVAAAVLGYGGM